MREQVIFREDALNIPIILAPLRPAFKYPGEHPHRRVAQPIGEGTRIEYMHGQVGSEPAIELDDPGSNMLRNPPGMCCPPLRFHAGSPLNKLNFCNACMFLKSM
jgi:hypothetical protein